MHTFIRVSTEWIATENNYQIDYFIGLKEMHFIANAEQMAAECLATKFITGYVGRTVTTYDPINFDQDVEMPLNEFISGWSQKMWFDFITSYEQRKSLVHTYQNAKAQYERA